MRISRRSTQLKIKRPKELQRIIRRLKSKGKIIVFTNGCFDLLHYGHIKLLEEAKKKGDILVVAINADASVRRIKGKKRPLLPQKDRLGIVAALESVDYVLAFKENTPFKIIKLLRPNILVKGADWNKDNIVGRDLVLSYGGRVATIKLIKGRSTSKLIAKIAKAFANKKY
jgi:D-beta-D-heptose 7-phosphate kinase/D-beta-D-heptose 1-phosphate adenosyltransferase